MKFLTQRKITVPLLLLRLLAVALVTLVVYFIFYSKYDYGIFFFILLLPISFIGINQVCISEHEVGIRKYQVFGLRIRRYKLTIANILMVSLSQQSLSVDDPVVPEESDLVSMAGLLGPYGELIAELTEFKYLDKNNDIQSLKIKLKPKEYKLAWEVLNRDERSLEVRNPS